MAQVAGLLATGSYSVTAHLKATTQLGEAYELTLPTSHFERVPGTYRLWLMNTLRRSRQGVLLVLLLLVAWFIFVSSGPYPHGTLVFQQRTTGALADIREWETLKSIPISRHRVLGGLIRPRWPTIKNGVPKVVGFSSLKIRRLDGDKGISIVAQRADKRPAVTFEFNRDQQSRAIDNQFKIVYENVQRRKGT